MITNITPSQLDREKLASRNYRPPNPADALAEYAGVVVKKPWGLEYLAFQNRAISVWVLHLKKGHATSLHCHATKKTAIIVLKGSVVFRTLEQEFGGDVGTGVTLEKGVFHATQAISEGGAVILEIETPINKKDLVRLEDRYGREQLGYENEAAEFPRNIDLHQSFLDEQPNAVFGAAKPLGDCIVRAVRHENYQSFRAHLNETGPCIVCIADGSIAAGVDMPPLAPGDVISSTDFPLDGTVHSETLEILLIK